MPRNPTVDKGFAAVWIQLWTQEKLCPRELTPELCDWLLIRIPSKCYLWASVFCNLCHILSPALVCVCFWGCSLHEAAANIKLDCTGQQASSTEYWALHSLENETKFRVQEQKIFNHGGSSWGKDHGRKKKGGRETRSLSSRLALIWKTQTQSLNVIISLCFLQGEAQSWNPAW